MTFHLTSSSVWVAEGPPFGKIAALLVDHMFSLYFDYFSYFPFGF